MKGNKKVIILSILLVLIVIGVAIGLSYAYFATIERNNADLDVNTEITTKSNVEFNPGDSIELINVEPGAYSETEFDVSLTAPNKSSDTITYGIIWDITENEFEYETEHFDPQLTYSLYYKMSPDEEWNVYVEDADCTTWGGTPKLIDSISLTADTNTTSTMYWKLRLDYKSYNYNQSINMNKKFKGTIKLDSEGI